MLGQRQARAVGQALPWSAHERPQLTWWNVAGAQLCANALYGFTGAQTSMLQCLPLADSCLAMGAASTRRAVDTIHELAADGAQEACVWRQWFNMISPL